MADLPANALSNTLLAFGPPGTFTLIPLSGGLINETVRATCKHASFVLKYAPPYFAARGPSVPFGQERQLIEAAALGLFTSWLDGRLECLSDETNVSVPMVLGHDVDKHVLCMTDFRESISLTAFVSLSSRMHDGVGLEHAAEIGARIGRFFGRLHSLSVFSLVKASPAGRQIVENRSGGRKLVREMIIESLESIMLRYSVDNDDASTLATAVTQDWDADHPERAFVLGDSWTGSILLRIAQDKLEMAVIDWEFASFDSSGLCSDIATMLVHLRLRYLAAQSAGNNAMLNACDTLALEMVKSYRQTSEDEKTPWTQIMSKSGIVEQLCRRFLIAVGRDIIHAAAMSEFNWHCTCCAFGAATETCALRVSMVRDGVMWLKAGTSSTTEQLWEFAEADDALNYLLVGSHVVGS